MTSFLYDTRQLTSITSENTYKQGLRYFKDNRVIECYLHQDQLFALVEGASQDLPYDVSLYHNEQGELFVVCDCDHSARSVCTHGVAALLAYANDYRDEEAQNFSSVRENAINDRVKRGKTEVRVKHLSGHPCFGLWQAASLVSSTHWQQSYEVHIRSLSERINYCTCPDLATNQLGTCKHIEAVIHQLHHDLDTGKTNQSSLAPIPFVFASWEEDTKIRVQRTANMAPDLTGLIDDYFNVQGDFYGELPDDFFRFSDSVYGREDISIGFDARKVVQDLVTKQSHQIKAQKIRQRIMQSNGILPGIDAKLYSYQIEGVAFLAANGRALLADDMGLGKTLQAIAAACWLIEESGVKRVLIICPASLKQQWAREIQKFTGKETQIIQGNAEARQAQYRKDIPFFIINYELVLRDLSVINELLCPDLVILDEAQRIKNWRTKIASTIKLIASRYAFVLTGTPLENRLEDLYSLMQVVDKNLLGPLWRYFNDYHIADEKGKVLGYRNLSRLRELIGPVMLRRNRSIVSSQLPARTTTRLDIEMTNKQKELHDSGLSAANSLAQIAKKRPLTPSEQNRMMAALQQARMACNAAGLVDKETQGSPKLKELKTLVEELCLDNGQKMVVFSQWRGMTIMIEEMLKSMNVGFVHLNGQVPTHKRGELMDAFREDDSISVFISTDAGGTGLNLQSASVLVNMDIPWNPAILEQRNARVHRLGQTNKVQIILMISIDSYEERVMQLVKNKQQLFDNVVDPEAEEDVVGISRQGLASVIEELANIKTVEDRHGKSSVGELGEISEVETTAEAADAFDSSIIAAEAQKEWAENVQINEGITQLQNRFGERLQQIMAKGRGLLLIVDRVEAEDTAFIQQLEFPVPMALLDVFSQQQLARLGNDSPIADARVLNTVKTVAPIRKWLVQAKEKLGAIQLLLEHKSNAGVMELLGSVITSFLNDKADAQQAMPIDDASVWIYSEGLPNQLISDEEASALSRILSLRFASNIPQNLLEKSYEDVREVVEKEG